MKKYVIALDQGTTSSRAVVFDADMEIVGKAQREFRQIYPKAGYVEHDPEEIYFTQKSVLEEVVMKTGISADEIAAIGITNQRETTVVWDKNTGKPVYNAIVWQCRRTSDLCDEIKKSEMNSYIRENTGLVTDAYFSATKIKWILDNVPDARRRAEAGKLLFGTVDCWLLWRFSKRKVHATDETNASRTMLYNIKTHEWDETLLSYFDIPKSMLPEVRQSGDFFGEALVDGKPVPITGIAGDQQSSLFGQSCFEEGDVKNTYGTGCFLLMNIGEKFRIPGNGLITTVAAEMKGKHSYAVEGSVFTGGAVVQWLRDEMQLILNASDSEDAALSVKDTGGVFLVPAFTGLGAPYWDMYSRGTVVGITRGTNKNHIVRAALEAIAYQSQDVLACLSAETGKRTGKLKVDGGAAANGFLMQFQADISGVDIIRPKIIETTALGAATLAGLTVGFYPDKSEIAEMQKTDRVFKPQMSAKEASEKLEMWHRAVERASGWLSE